MNVEDGRTTLDAPASLTEGRQQAAANRLHLHQLQRHRHIDESIVRRAIVDLAEPWRGRVPLHAARTAIAGSPAPSEQPPEALH